MKCYCDAKWHVDPGTGPGRGTGTESKDDIKIKMKQKGWKLGDEKETQFDVDINRGDGKMKMWVKE